MPIPDAERAVVPVEKVVDYLLNLDHPDGGSKAMWLESLGYTPGDWRRLANDLLAIATKCESFDIQTNRFGVKYKAAGMLGSRGRRPGRAVTVWIVEGDDAPRLVTAHPDKSL